MRHVIVVQHVPPEGIGSIAHSLKAADIKAQTCEIFAGHAVPQAINGAAGVIIMGGPMGVYEQDRHPFLTHELNLLRSALDANKPILGICLGSQLLAAALGSRVYPGRQKEIGWHEVKRSDAAKADKLFSDAPDAFQAFHWHGDVFDVPQGAVPLLSSELTPCQAFRFGAAAYGLLCHLEVTQTTVAAMAETFGDELISVGGNGRTIIKKTARNLPSLQTISRRVFDQWVGLL
ncbi:MAG: type 1 glutamine amidotransferase [Phycisphaerae bacterium]